MKQPTTFGKYLLLERINVGGMAEVFRAKAFGVEGFERLVAVKRILPRVAEDPEFVRMFIEEAKLSAQLSHANIAQIFDLGVIDGSYYLALEHVHGRDLRGISDRCRQLGDSMTVAQACFLAMKVCEGLDYAHNKRDPSGRALALVHRDLSPQNILVSFEGEVKLIDFGIARATGTRAAAPVGVPVRSDGKLGYMSPEQVRGLPLDRRSDVFSCGIVLYELLTGERLFAGDSDASITEKVRNVEILPPSTYNRRIPDELERIVLKALAGDVDGRYQHAIDLHDELQAFVYTAGEFYSRKDLAGWMKRTFAHEIEDETAKLERDRQLRPPAVAEALEPTVEAATLPSKLVRRKPTQPVAVISPPPPPSAARSQPVPVLTAPPPAAQAQGPLSAPTSELAARRHRPTELGWDDDELETRVFDQQDDEPRHRSNRTSLPLQPPVASSPELTLAAPERADASRPMPASAPNRSSTAAPRMPPVPPVGGGGDVRVVDDPMLAFGARVAGRRQSGDRQRNILTLALGSATLATITVIAVILLSGKLRPSAAPAPAPAPVVPAPVLVAEPSTGFDLYVSPAGVTQWKLDGDSRTDRLPSRIRGIAPGPHTVQIAPPPGFLSHNQQVMVELGKAPRVEITLQPIAGIHGVFDSSPPGATVSLIIDGKRQTIGPSPATAPLDPRSTYQVLFEKPGYVSVNRPITFSGGLEERVVANLEPATASTRPVEPRAAPAPVPARDPRDDRSPVRPAPMPEAAPDRRAAAPARGSATAAQGVLVLGSKPPCDIAIDGTPTGLHTPQPELKLAAGRHRITLTNSEFGIKETFTVDIKPGAAEKVIKDYSDRLPD